MITIVGLGMEKNDLSLRGAEAIRSAKTVLLRTAQTASAESVKALGVPYASLDSVYEKSRNFDSLQKNIVAEVLRAAKEGLVSEGYLKIYQGDVLLERRKLRADSYLPVQEIRQKPMQSD